jgi:hypothetical protein
MSSLSRLPTMGVGHREVFAVTGIRSGRAGCFAWINNLHAALSLLAEGTDARSAKANSAGATQS